MTKDEFFRLAKREFIIDIPSFYVLKVYKYDADIKGYRKMPKKNEWYFPIFCSTTYYSTFEKALEYYRQFCAEDNDKHSLIQCASIDRIALDEGFDSISLIDWWLLDKKGNVIDNSVCSIYYIESRDRQEGIYFGRFTHNLRFKEGDIVEVRLSDNRVELGIINGVPPTVSEEWEHYQRIVQKWGPIKDSDEIFKDGYFGDYFSDVYFLLGDNGFDPDESPCHILKPTFKVPESAYNYLTCAYLRWKENVDDAVSGKISWDRLGQIVRGEA